MPPISNSYHLTVEAQGFKPLVRDVDVRTAVPITLDLTLALEGTSSSVDVVGHVQDLVERDPSAHTDLDQSLISKMLVESSAGLNQVVTLASPGVVSDSNGSSIRSETTRDALRHAACLSGSAGGVVLVERRG